MKMIKQKGLIQFGNHPSPLVHSVRIWRAGIGVMFKNETWFYFHNSNAQSFARVGWFAISFFKGPIE